MHRASTALVSDKLNLTTKQFKIQSLETIKKPTDKFCVTKKGMIVLVYLNESEIKTEFHTPEGFIQCNEIKDVSGLFILPGCKDHSVLICHVVSDAISKIGMISQISYEEEKKATDLQLLRNNFSTKSDKISILDFDDETYIYNENENGNLIRFSKTNGAVLNKIYTDKKFAWPVARLPDNRLIVKAQNQKDSELVNFFQIWSFNEKNPDIEFEWDMTTDPIILSDGRIVIGLRDRVIVASTRKNNFTSEFLKDHIVGQRYTPVQCLLQLPDGSIACMRNTSFEIWNPNSREILFKNKLLEQDVYSMSLLSTDTILLKTLSNVSFLKLNVELVMDASPETAETVEEEVSDVIIVAPNATENGTDLVPDVLSDPNSKNKNAALV